ncbi:MAG: peptidyl-prolyl cis-trans isomerase, partial [Planctomycetota bacterium]
MARQQRKKIKFSPFRMGKRFEKAVLVALGVFLMVIFAVPFSGSCRQRGGGGPGQGEVWATVDGTKVTYGEIRDYVRRHSALFGKQYENFDLPGYELAQYHEARRAGIYVSDAEVHDQVRNTLFPRRVRVEWAIAETSEFEEGLEDLDPSQRQQRAAERARQAVEAVKDEVDVIIGEALRGALKRAAVRHDLAFGQSQAFTPRGARRELDKIRDVPGITKSVFREPSIGQLSEPAAIEGGYCVYRVVLRSRGFGPEGNFYRKHEGWAGKGYGTLSVKTYQAMLRDRGVSQPDIEQTLRERLTIAMLEELVRRTALTVPEASVRDRYERNNTQAVGAYFAVRARDFTEAVTLDDEELQAFYDEHKRLPPAQGRVGYLQPERVSIEYVLGRKDELARTLGEETLRRYYRRFRDRYEGEFEDVVEAVRSDAADHELKRLISRIAGQAAEAVAADREPDLAALTSQAARLSGGAFEYHRTGPFSAREADNVVPRLKGGDLSEELFGSKGRQYVAAGQPREPGTHVVSTDFSCDAGRYFFRLLRRSPEHALPYQEFVSVAERRQRLERDFRNRRALERAREAATSYRQAIGEAAIERLAELTGASPVETDFLTADQPVPPVDQPMQSLYRELGRGAIGDVSPAVAVGDRYVVARLVDREEGKGLKLEVLAFEGGAVQGQYEPSEFQLRAAYEADSYAFLEPPEPVPFDEVKDEIRALLRHRQALDIATERADALAREVAHAEEPDLKAAARKHAMAFHPDVKVDLETTEKTPHVGKAAGFGDAVTDLEPGTFSEALADAEGRYVILLKSRGDDQAVIDVASVAYDAVAEGVEIEDEPVRAYYDEHRDVAYVTGDEIEEAPAWPALDKAARQRVREHVVDAWTKQPEDQQVAAVRDAAVQEAFRTVPTRSPVTAPKPLRPTVTSLGPFPLSKPAGVFAGEPELVEALRQLQVGEVTQPLATDTAAILALLAATTPGGEAEVSVAVFAAPDFLDAATEPTDEAIQAYYEEHKETFRVPETATVELLLADRASRQKTLAGQLTEDEVRDYYAEHRASYVGQSFEQAKARVRSDLARQRADALARQAAQGALDSLRKDPEADLKTLADELGLVYAVSEPFALRDPVTLEATGEIRNLADDVAAAQAGAPTDRVVRCEKGYTVCRVQERRPARIPPLTNEQVRRRAVRALKLDSAREAAHEAAERFRAQAAGTAFEKALTAMGDQAPSVVRGRSVEAPDDLTLPGKGKMPKLTEAILALDEPGLTPVVDEADASCVAWVSERRREQLVQVDVATIGRRQVRAFGMAASDEELEAHYEAHKEEFRVPDRLKVEYVAADYETLGEALDATEAELRQEYNRSIKEGETDYRDWTKPRGRFFLPFEKAREQVRRNVLTAKAKTRARTLLTEAAEALREQGDEADLEAYAKDVEGLEAGTSDFFDATTRVLPPLGRAPEVVKRAFAAKAGELVGPEFGPEGAMVFRRGAIEKSHIPPLEERRGTVEAHLLRQRDIERAVGVAATLRDRVVDALAKAPDARAAFRQAVEGQPVIAEVPVPARVTVTQPFYPLEAGWRRSSRIPGLGEHPALNRSVFRLRQAEMTPVLDDPD